MERTGLFDRILDGRRLPLGAGQPASSLGRRSAEPRLGQPRLAGQSSFRGAASCETSDGGHAHTQEDFPALFSIAQPFVLLGAPRLPGSGVDGHQTFLIREDGHGP